MSSYQIRTETGEDGIRRWHVWWNPCRYTPDHPPVVEKLGVFYSPGEAQDAIATDRHRRAGETT